MQSRNELQIKRTALRDLRTDISNDLIVHYVIDHLIDTDVFTEEDRNEVLTGGHSIGNAEDLAVRDSILFQQSVRFIDKLCEKMLTKDYAFSSLIYILMSEGHYPWLGKKILNRVMVMKDETDRLAQLQHSTVAFGPESAPEPPPQQLTALTSGSQPLEDQGVGQQHLVQMSGDPGHDLEQQELLGQLVRGIGLAPEPPQRLIGRSTSVGTGLLQERHLAQGRGGRRHSLAEQQLIGQLVRGITSAPERPLHQIGTFINVGTGPVPHHPLGQWPDEPESGEEQSQHLEQPAIDLESAQVQPPQPLAIPTSVGTGPLPEHHLVQCSGEPESSLEQSQYLGQPAIDLESTSRRPPHQLRRSISIGTGLQQEQHLAQISADRRHTLEEQQLLRQLMSGIGSGDILQQQLSPIGVGLQQQQVVQNVPGGDCVSPRAHTPQQTSPQPYDAMRGSTPDLYNQSTYFSQSPALPLNNYGHNRYPSVYNGLGFQSFGGFPVSSGVPNYGPMQRFGALPVWGVSPVWNGMPGAGGPGWAGVPPGSGPPVWMGPPWTGPGLGGYGSPLAGVGPGMQGSNTGPPYPPYVVFQCNYILYRF